MNYEKAKTKNMLRRADEGTAVYRNENIKLLEVRRN
jgi:hypothetical protein